MSDIKDDFKKAKKDLEEYSNHTYDGVKGELPDFPKRDQNDFRRIRNRLLKGYSHAELLGYVEEALSLIDCPEDSYLRFSMPPEIDDDIFTLAGYKIIDRVYREEGREAGLALLTDSNIAILEKKGSDYSETQSAKAGKPRGKINTDDGDTTISGIIKDLATKSRTIWTRYFSEPPCKRIMGSFYCETS